MNKQLPLIVILGATACGKSKLAIELARRFGGEIISADSMQVYQGLDIVTNKVTESEQLQAKHHMISFLNPTQRYSVVDFRSKSLNIIGDLLNQNKLPIIVGGTNYYIESVLWKNITLPIHPNNKLNEDTVLDSEAKKVNDSPNDLTHNDRDLEDPEAFFSKPIYGDGFKEIDSEKLWSLLEKVDSKSAHRYHPHDKRKIIRCLQVIQTKKQSFSEIFENLNKFNDTERLGGPLRFEKTLILWLNCEYEVLDEVLDKRVDQMIEKGLLAELEKFHKDHNEQRMKEGAEPDYDKGIFQTIGFKEFHQYLTLDEAKKESPEGKKILEKSLWEMKMSTRRYARRQLKWIRRRFLQSGTRDLPVIFKLDAVLDDVSWDEKIKQPAFQIVESFIENKPLSEPILRLKEEPEVQSIANEPAKHYCEPCERLFIGSRNIEEHLKSRSHERRSVYLRDAKRRRTADSSVKI